jgi:hypothetical protein
LKAVCQHLEAACQHLKAVCQHLKAVCQHLKAACQHLRAACQHFEEVGRAVRQAACLWFQAHRLAACVTVEGLASTQSL